MKIPVSDKERELMNIIIPWCKERDLEREDALAIGLCCRGDEASQEMIDILKENPDIDYCDLLLKASEIHTKMNKK